MQTIKKPELTFRVMNSTKELPVGKYTVMKAPIYAMVGVLFVRGN